jgi:MOSC domain-containing protein YiiM
MRPVDPAVFVRDGGIEGDCHGRPKSRRQVLLIEAETLDALGVPAGAVKENVTTRGIDLMGLERDTRLGLGAQVVLWVTGPCAPCALMNDVRPGLEEALRGRRGVLAWVERGGSVRVGDVVRVLPESA